jgi:hypothetical protein
MSNATTARLLGTKRPPRIVVAESYEVVLPLKSGTIILRPGQHLDNEILIRLAAEHGVLTEER